MSEKEKKTKKRPSNFNDVIKNIDRDEVEIFADLGAGSANLATQFYKRFDSDILIIPVNEAGEFDDGDNKELKNYISRLESRGVDMSKVKILNQGEEIPKVDVVSTIGSFGDKYKFKFSKTWLDNLLRNESRWITDIKNGSGGYKLARKIGNANTLCKFEEDGKIFARCVVSVEPDETAPQSSEDLWKHKAEALIGSDGFYRAGEEHSFTYIPRGKTLVVTFDNLDIAMVNRGDRMPWGYSYIEKQNHSMLGVMANGWTWYRDPWVIEQFNQLKENGFFDQFENVVFYGASMGGYAALAFAPSAKNAQVVVFSPQSTVDKSVVPWETRYKAVWGRDFSGEYGDAAQTSQQTKSVHIFYDPYQPLDAKHAERLNGAHIHHYHMPLMGHKVGTNLLRMGVLQDVVNDAINDELTPKRFHGYMAKRKDLRRYLVELFNMAKNKKHYGLAYIVALSAHNKNPKDKFFERHMMEMQEKLEKPSL